MTELGIDLALFYKTFYFSGSTKLWIEFCTKVLFSIDRLKQWKEKFLFVYFLSNDTTLENAGLHPSYWVVCQWSGRVKSPARKPLRLPRSFRPKNSDWIGLELVSGPAKGFEERPYRVYFDGKEGDQFRKQPRRSEKLVIRNRTFYVWEFSSWGLYHRINYGLN